MEKPKQIKKRIVVEGGDATGKSTITKALKKLGYENVFDRGLISKATVDEMPEKIPEDTLYLMLDISVEVALERIRIRGKEVDSYWHSENALCLYRQKYKELSVDADRKVEDVVKMCVDVISGKDTSRKVMNIDTLTEEEFNKCKLIVEGESKIVREANSVLNLVVMKMKPTVHSFTHNRCGVVDGTDKLRAECTQLLLDPVRAGGINHSYWQVNEKFALSDRIFNPPPIEVIVKKYHMGTPKYRYYGMHKCKVRTDYVKKGFVLENEKLYPKQFVRFDWRNPMFHPDTKKRLADEVLCDDHADFFINVKNAKVTAMKTFNILQEHFNKCGIELCDICFYISEDGKTVFSEISQDCGRYRRIGGEGESLDKDVWRSGGSPELIGKKWKQLLDLLRKNKWAEKNVSALSDQHLVQKKKATY